jgi:hypothetical protein
MEGHQTLGLFITGDGTSMGHKGVMAEKGVTYATAYGAYYIPSLVYGNPETTLLYKECEDIQHPVVASVGSRTRDRVEEGPALVTNTMSHQGKTYARAVRDGVGNVRKSRSLLHLTSKE